MLKVFTLLEANWGQWRCNPATGKLHFQEPNVLDEYNRDCHELQSALREMTRLEAEVKQLRGINF